MELLLGSNNAHKADELAALLREIGARVLRPAELGIDEQPVEDGPDFETNAAIKARFFLERSGGRPVLADDSGLEVDCLDGRPGVRSARYAPSDAERIARLLEEVGERPEPERTARFVCVAALARPGGVLRLERGVCEGRIAPAPVGAGGFGYDPIFYLPERGRTLAQLPADEKNAISHRGRALRAMLPALREALTP